MKRNNIGQGMTEYLIMVGLIAISAIAVTRGTSQNLKAGFGKISNALQGKEEQGNFHEVSDEEVKGRSLNDFQNGVSNK